MGKIIRARDDGSIPPHNPFVGRKPTSRASTRSVTPIRCATNDPPHHAGALGPRGGDELNKIEAGKNYGWILVIESAHYNQEPTKLGKNSVPGMTDVT